MNAGDLQEVIKSVEATEQVEGLIILKEDKWLMKAVDDATVLMFATLVPEEAMIEYEPGDEEEVGIWLGEIKDMIDDKSEPITLRLENHKLIVEHNGFEASLPTIDSDSVTGVARQTPGSEQCVSFDMEFDRLSSFLKKADNVTGTGHYFMSPRRDGLYLYAGHNNKEIKKCYKWSTMENVTLDFESGNSPPDGGKFPAEDEAVDTILALDYTRNMNEMADIAEVHVDNHYPVKFVFQMESGIKGSYIISPRMPGGDSMVTLPDRLVDEENTTISQ